MGCGSEDEIRQTKKKRKEKLFKSHLTAKYLKILGWKKISVHMLQRYKETIQFHCDFFQLFIFNSQDESHLLFCSVTNSNYSKNMHLTVAFL